MSDGDITLDIDEERLIEKYITLCVTLSSLTDGRMTPQDVEDFAHKELDNIKLVDDGKGRMILETIEVEVDDE